MILKILTITMLQQNWLQMINLIASILIWCISSLIFYCQVHTAPPTPKAKKEVEQASFYTYFSKNHFLTTFFQRFHFLITFFQRIHFSTKYFQKIYLLTTFFQRFHFLTTRTRAALTLWKQHSMELSTECKRSLSLVSMWMRETRLTKLIVQCIHLYLLTDMLRHEMVQSYKRL